MSADKVRAAKWILREALELRKDAPVLVIHDEGTQETAIHLEKAAAALQAKFRAVLVSYETQQQYRHDPARPLPPAVVDGIVAAGTVLILQEWRPENTKFRLLVLQRCETLPGCRAASMPGLTADYLRNCGGDLDALEARCALVAHRLIWGRKITVTVGSAEFSTDIGDYAPIVSTGRIRRGWGNVPSGETFVVPNLGSAHGRLIINGSAPLTPLHPDSHVAFDVCDGRIGSPIRGPGAERVRPLLFDPTGHECTPNCSVISEFGFGLNPTISTFAGLPLFDEKICGTIHIGTGSSTQFDGPTSSTVHHDFVTIPDTVTIDHTLVVEQGRFVLTELAVWPHWSEVPLYKFDAAANYICTRNAMVDTKKDGRMLAVLEWTTKRARFLHRMHTQVGCSETAQLAYHVLEAIDQSQRAGVGVSAPEIISRVSPIMSADATAHVLELLLRFRLVRAA